MTPQETLTYFRELLAAQLQPAFTICCSTEPPLSKVTFIARAPNDCTKFLLISNENMEDFAEVFAAILDPHKKAVISDFPRKGTLQ